MFKVVVPVAPGPIGPTPPAAVTPGGGDPASPESNPCNQVSGGHTFWHGNQLLMMHSRPVLVITISVIPAEMN
jgi:hypothetical protein